LRFSRGGAGKNRKTAVFPKLVFAIRDSLNHKFGDPNYDIKQLALECASKRMYPDILNYDQVVKVTTDTVPNEVNGMDTYSNNGGYTSSLPDRSGA
ncbi:anaerobic ribonucleoside-triphosphate reductase, partial [Klebsiella pneumoniae]|uniref:anaerobic ribonucleoside-triphosphate reductase n=1 Tax=Klebsiella pneumoniae TaxID=573 RepID=UPI00210C2E6C